MRSLGRLSVARTFEARFQLVSLAVALVTEVVPATSQAGQEAERITSLTDPVLDMSQTTLTLRNGVRIPALGLGTYKAFGNDVPSAVCVALQADIRQNEDLVAEGIRLSGVPRSEVFVCSKLSPSQQGSEKALQGCRDMVDKLGAPVDLALIHWPGASNTAVGSEANARLRQETWRVMEDMYGQGIFRAIGVSNFEIHHLRQLMEAAQVPPMVNQIEVHPRRPSSALREFCRSHGIVVVAYSPLGQGQLTDHPTVRQLATRINKTPAQVLLRWGLQQGCVVIPKSVRPERIREFADLLSPTWELSPADMAALNALEDGHKFCWNPDTVA